MLKILVIETRALGDIVQGLQLVTSLKAQREDVSISWIVRETFAPLLRASAAVDHTYVFQRNGGAQGFLRLMKEVRKTEFDYVFDLQGQLRSGLMTSRARAKKKVGRTDAKEWAGIFYNQKVPLPPQGRASHSLEILLQFCEVLGLKPEVRGSLVFREVGSLNLQFADGRAGTKPILMFPDSRRADRRWVGFKELTEMLLRDGRGRKVIWAGNNYINDRNLFHDGQFLNLTGNTSLVSLPALIQRADWVISNDSGPMHLAAALNVRVLGIFGPTDPRLAGPYPLTKPSNHVVQAPLGDLRLLSTKEVYARFQRIDTPVRTKTVAH